MPELEFMGDAASEIIISRPDASATRSGCVFVETSCQFAAVARVGRTDQQVRNLADDDEPWIVPLDNTKQMKIELRPYQRAEADRDTGMGVDRTRCAGQACRRGPGGGPPRRQDFEEQVSQRPMRARDGPSAPTDRGNQHVTTTNSAKDSRG